MNILRLELLEQPPKTIHGLHLNSNDQAQHWDIPKLSHRLHQLQQVPSGRLLPLYVLSRDYDSENRVFTLFVGSDHSHSACSAEQLPAGTYARIEVRPKLGFLWEPSIKEAKHWFYDRWLPTSPYESIDLEYELHTEKSLDSHPAIDLFFGIRPKRQ